MYIIDGMVCLLLCDSQLNCLCILDKPRHLRTSFWALGNTDQYLFVIFFCHFLTI